MKHLYQLATQLAGNTSRRTAAAAVTLPYAILRVLLLWVDELPAGFSCSANILEWAVGLLGLIFILIRKFDKTNGE